VWEGVGKAVDEPSQKKRCTKKKSRQRPPTLGQGLGFGPSGFCPFEFENNCV